ncbi:MAG: hypothetical protein RIS47_990 [Bacteroidota bacterium]|jgi:6-phosphofructokinase 1
MNTQHKTIAILTGGSDVPGLNPAIRAITIRAIKEGYRVLGLRRGWAGLLEIDTTPKANNIHNFVELSVALVNKAARTGGTFLHTTRIRPDKLMARDVPTHLHEEFPEATNDLTPVIVRNLEWLGVDYLIPIGGDDTLGYALKLHKLGIKIVAIPKTMDNDVPGTDYCIGFSTCVTRSISLANSLRTSAGSLERILILEVFGRYAGYTAMLPTLTGSANRCVIPEHPFHANQLVQLLAQDRDASSNRYAVVIVSEGARMIGFEDQLCPPEEIDFDDTNKKGGIGQLIADQIQTLSPEYNRGKTINTIYQKLGYMVRGGDPDAIDSLVPMAFGNMAMDLIGKNITGRLVILKNGRYDHTELEVVATSKNLVDVARFYNTERLRPFYNSFDMHPLFIMTGQ